MKLNELSKSFNSKNKYLSFLVIITLLNYFSGLIAAQKGKLSETTDKSYVVRVYFRNFYDMKNDVYDDQSEFNKLGFNSNSKRDSIFIFLKLVDEQAPLARWFVGKNNPNLMVIRFENLPKAQSFYDKIEANEYGFIVKKAMIEKYIPNCRIKRN